MRTAEVEERESDEVIGTTALTVPSFMAVIRVPPTDGLAPRYVPPVTDMIMKAIDVQDGDYVKKGQLLFETDDTIFKQILEQRKTAVTAAEALVEFARLTVAYNQKVRDKEFTSAKSEVGFRTDDLVNRQKEFEIMKTLRQQDGAASLIDFYDAQSKYQQALFDMDEAKRRQEWATDSIQVGSIQDKELLARVTRDAALALIDLEQTRRGLDDCRLTSPIDGFIDGKVNVVPGQTISVTSGLARVVQLNPIYVRLDYPQERLTSVAVGQEAEVTLDSFPGETFHGRVIRTSAQVNPQLRVLPVTVEVNNPGNRILAGISGSARLHAMKKVALAPSTAVIDHDHKAMVFRVENGKAHLQEIKTGQVIDNGMVEITSGLNPGDEVVVYFSNFYRHWGEASRLDAYLQDNDLVDSDWRKWAGRE